MAVERFGEPEIFNSDQGSQFTSTEFISELRSLGVQISIDGRGRCLDNAKMERFWWPLKYEDIKIKEYVSLPQLRFTSDYLREAVMLMCESGSMIITDGLKSYSSLSKNGYSQIIDEAVGTSDKYPLPYCHMVSYLLKRWIIGTQQGSVSQEHLQDYLNEFVFRFNRRKSASRGKLFYRLVQHSVISSHVTYHSITRQSEIKG